MFHFTKHCCLLSTRWIWNRMIKIKACILFYYYHFLKSSSRIFSHWFRVSGKGRERRETMMWERKIDGLPPHCDLTGLGMEPAAEENALTRNWTSVWGNTPIHWAHQLEQPCIDGYSVTPSCFSHSLKAQVSEIHFFLSVSDSRTVHVCPLLPSSLE